MKSCRDCAFGVDAGEDVLNCRRYPPTVYTVRVSGDGLNISSYNPLVHESFWCGEWKAISKRKA